VRACSWVHALSWLSVHGGQYARAFFGRLHKIICSHRRLVGRNGGKICVVCRSGSDCASGKL